MELQHGDITLLSTTTCKDISLTLRVATSGVATYRVATFGVATFGVATSRVAIT
jgi:hypothetical protein